MVLCAVSKDHSQVCLLDVPDNTPIGAQVTFPGFPGDNIPATPSQMVKKKILEGLAPKVTIIYCNTTFYSSLATHYLIILLFQ